MRTKVIKYHTLSEMELLKLAQNLFRIEHEYQNPVEPAPYAPIPEASMKTILAQALREMPRE